MLGAVGVDPNRVAIYIRWSTEEQGQGTTLEVQRDACKHFVLSQGWEFKEELVFVDDGYSGANMNRPALDELRQAVSQGLVAAVVVYKLDRLSRNLLDCVSLVRQEWANIALFSTMERFDTNSSMGQMVFNILVSFAEFERNVIRERTMSGKRKRREQGKNSGFKYPFGYRKGTDGGFEINPEEAAVVRGMFADYIAGLGFQGVADRLNAQGIPAPMGGMWRTCTVSLILQNPFYAGHYVAGYYSYEDGKQKRGKTPGLTIENAVPALISQEDFDRAQQARGERQRGGYTRSRDSDYVLSTLLRCGKCGAPMIGHNGSSKRYYRCTTAKEFGTCDNGAVPAEDLEQTVLSEIQRDLAPEHLRAHIAALDARRQEEIEKTRKLVRSLVQQMTEAQAKREKLDADYLDGSFDAKQYARLSDRVDRETDALHDQLAQARADLLDLEQRPVDQDRLMELANQVDGLAEFGPVEVRSVLKQLLASLTVYRPKKRGRWNLSPIELTMEHNIRLPPSA